MEPETLKILSRPLQCYRNAPLAYQPDRSALLRKRNNALMKWMQWAGDRMHLTKGKLRSESNLNEMPDSAYLKYLKRNGEGEDVVHPKSRSGISSGRSYFLEFCILLIILGACALFFSKKSNLSRRMLTSKARYSRLKQSV